MSNMTRNHWVFLIFTILASRSTTSASVITKPAHNDSTSSTDLIIESPHVTNWGLWGQLDLCPEGTFASGMQLKSEPIMGDDDDDTALNGIRLLCTAAGSNDFDNATIITSSTNVWGSWGKSFYCDRGVVVGFQLRAEAVKGDRGDDTASNNLRVFCSNLVGIVGGYLEGDGRSWGDWTDAQMCLSQQAVCGIRTQSESWAGDGDDTAINNVQMKCCPAHNIGNKCDPTDNWELVLECDNTKGTQPMKCTYQKTQGVTKSTKASQTYIEEYKVMMDIGFTASALYNALAANFRYNLTVSSNTGYSWYSESSETFHEATVSTTEFLVPGGMRCRLSQAVGTCGYFGAFSNYFMKEDFDVGGCLVSEGVFTD